MASAADAVHGAEDSAVRMTSDPFGQGENMAWTGYGAGIANAEHACRQTKNDPTLIRRLHPDEGRIISVGRFPNTGRRERGIAGGGRIISVRRSLMGKKREGMWDEWPWCAFL